jgi:hypothetical protein
VKFSRFRVTRSKHNASFSAPFGAISNMSAAQYTPHCIAKLATFYETAKKKAEKV